MKCAELSAPAGSAAERNLSNGAPAAPRAVGRGEINRAGAAFGGAGSGTSEVYFDEIQLSSEGLARNFFSRSMSSGRILPSSAATSQTASKLDRE